VDYGQPPDRVLRAGGLKVLPEAIRPREGRGWQVEWHGMPAVLRQLPVPAGAVAAARLLADVAWLHAYLLRLAGTGFPSPRPLPSFAGKSWAIAEGMLWEIVSFLPGQVVGWAGQPAMAEIGALLGRYHAAARGVGVARQRPGALPLVAAPAVLLSGRLQAVGVAPREAALIRELATQLARDLADIGHQARPQVVIHGDFTSHNVLAGGSPPRVTGVIDFALAHAETELADIGYGLWRSGRPHQNADHVDLQRAADFLRGYASTAMISADEARVIPVYLRGRGLQMIAKRVRAGRAETGMLAQVQWLNANSRVVSDALAAALPPAR
jgi:Ser/Thr protein kinase RdoA (MazF antagonist)